MAGLVDWVDESPYPPNHDSHKIGFGASHSGSLKLCHCKWHSLNGLDGLENEAHWFGLRSLTHSFIHELKQKHNIQEMEISNFNAIIFQISD